MEPIDPLIRRLLEVAPGALDENGFYETRRLPDGRWLVIEPQTFGRARLGLVEAGDDLAAALTANLGYTDVWDYASKSTAVAALRTWDGTGEPAGWSRHATSGRRRQPDGSIVVRE